MDADGAARGAAIATWMDDAGAGGAAGGAAQYLTPDEIMLMGTNDHALLMRRFKVRPLCMRLS